MIAVTTATFLSVVSSDFLLPYSPHPDIPPSQIQSPHFGLMSITEPIKSIQLIKIAPRRTDCME
jgi:hypothetical protein